MQSTICVTRTSGKFVVSAIAMFFAIIAEAPNILAKPNPQPLFSYNLTIVNDTDDTMSIALNGGASVGKIKPHKTSTLNFSAGNGVSLDATDLVNGKRTARGIGGNYNRKYTISYDKRGHLWIN